MDYERKLIEAYQRVLRQGGSPSFVICPTTYDKPCKLCSMCYEILKDRSLRGTPLAEKALSINQKHKYYSNIIFPAVNPSQVVVFEYGDKIFRKLSGFLMDPTGQAELKVFTDPIKGRNLFIKKLFGKSKERTDYDVEPSMAASSLPDPSVLNSLYPLDQIIQLMKTGEVKVISQAKLESERTEIRVLPSWLGPKSNMFFFPVNYHYGISEEEFNAIVAGELNPFANFLEAPIGPVAKSRTYFQEESRTTESPWSQVIPPNPIPAPPSPKIDPIHPRPLEAHGSVTPATPLKSLETPSQVGPSITSPKVQSESKGSSSIPSPESTYPDCFGQYGSMKEECEGTCATDGWAGPCKMMSAAKADRERRAAARRLST